MIAKRLLLVLAAGVVALVTACSGGSHGTQSHPASKPSSASTHSGQSSGGGGIPQNGGGDHDGDNSGGPSDGDGNI